MPPDFHRNVHCLLGLPFDAVDMAGAVFRVQDAVKQRQRCFLSTPNLNWLVACLKDDAFRNSVIESDLSIPDGAPLIWVARLLGIPIRRRVAGSTLFDLLRRDRENRISVFLFGGPDGVAELACNRLNQERKGVTCSGYESPGYGSIEEMSGDDVIQRINASGADFLLVALGARRGQVWIQRNRSRLSVPVISHLGAVVNFVAGTARRAPFWIQKLALEWLWRIKEEPGLWRRYFFDGLTFIRLLVTRVVPHAWFMRWNRPTKADLDSAAIEIHDGADERVIRLRGAWTGENLAPLRTCFANAAIARMDVRIDMADVPHVDTAFLGLMLLLHRARRNHGGRLVCHPINERVIKVFAWGCAEFVLRGNDAIPSIGARMSEQSTRRNRN